MFLDQKVINPNKMPNEEKNYPKTIAEAVDRLLSTLSEEDKEAIKNTAKNDLLDLHFGLGTYIRNAFGLWDKNEELLKACCPHYPLCEADEASGVIIDALWEKLRSEL